MQDSTEQIVNSLTGTGLEIYEFLPYLLQDLNFLGFNEEKTDELIAGNFTDPSSLHIIDLCCGKGALTVYLAEKYRCRCTGVDLFDNFITAAEQISKEKKVDDLCEYFKMDIKDAVNKFSGFDLAVFGEDTDTLGSRADSLKAIKKCIKNNGFLILETAFHSWQEMNNDIMKSGYSLINKSIWEKKKIKKFNKIINRKIRKRAEELIIEFPGKTELFLEYIKSQKEESSAIEDDFISAALLLKAV